MRRRWRAIGGHAPVTTSCASGAGADTGRSLRGAEVLGLADGPVCIDRSVNRSVTRILRNKHVFLFERSSVIDGLRAMFEDQRDTPCIVLQKENRMSWIRLPPFLIMLAFAGWANGASAPVWIWCEVTVVSENSSSVYYSDVFMGDDDRRPVYENDFMNYLKLLHPKIIIGPSSVLCVSYSTQAEGQKQSQFIVTHYWDGNIPWVNVGWYDGLTAT
jgi:hypothetical protein